jgi:hypothetical protein
MCLSIEDMTSVRLEQLSQRYRDEAAASAPTWARRQNDRADAVDALLEQRRKDGTYDLAGTGPVTSPTRNRAHHMAG